MKSKSLFRGNHPQTLDGRYFVVNGRLWRMSNPALAPDVRQRHVDELMAARREVWAARNDAPRQAAARKSVDRAKRALGERGPVWWADGAEDYNRHKVANTPYADWYATLKETSLGDQR
jgi:hypothetical protein